MKPSIKEFTKIDGNTTSYSIHGIKANAGIRVDQDVDLVLRNLKLKILGQLYDKVLLTTDKRFMHYKANDDRIILKHGLLFRKNYGATGNIQDYQKLMPKQLVDEVFQSLEDKPDQKVLSKRKTYDPRRSAQKFSPRATQNVHISKRRFGNLHGISRVCTHSVGNIKANNCSDRQQICHTFFQTKANPPALWNACDYVLQFNFKIAQIAVSVNTSNDILSRLELKVTDKIHLKSREDIQTIPIEATTSCSDVSVEGQFYLTQAENNYESEEQTLERIDQSLQNSKQWVSNEETPSLKTGAKKTTKIDRNNTSYSMNGIKANAQNG